MLRELLKHKLAYLILVIGLLGFAILFLAVWPNRNLQRLTAVTLVAYYATWGMVTHFKTRRLNSRVIYEYIGVSLVAGLLLFSVTW